MPGRRDVVLGLLASSLANPGWAEVGSPAFLSAGRLPEGGYVLCGLTAGGQISFTLPLPARGHAAAAHPTKPQAVAFARRPGRFALVIDCTSGRVIAEMTAPQGRHFYGHGTFSADGAILFTTENDYEAARGMVGLWDATRNFKRVGEFASGGIGPHDIKLMPDGRALVIANGGIETHPDSGRTKLNLPLMRSNLTYATLSGDILSQMTLGPAHQRNSIRHLAVSRGGDVAFAMQWQGDRGVDLPLLGVHRMGAPAPKLFVQASTRRMEGYLGSVAISADGVSLATTSPRRGLAQIFHNTVLTREMPLPDVCGVAASHDAFVVTTGSGQIATARGTLQRHKINWDNHLIEIG